MIVGYCILNGKKWVMFEDKQCAAGEVKLTDGFKDKLIRWNSDKLIGMESISKEEIDLRKVVKRMRGARPWHPLHFPCWRVLRGPGLPSDLRPRLLRFPLRLF